MKIAHIAPPWIAIPPKNYGGTEIVLFNLVEEQVAQGHEVTLFAPGDARTSARLIAFFPRSLIAAGVPWQAHLKAYYHLSQAVDYIKEHDFEIVHTHLSSSADMYLFPLTAQLATPHVMTLHSHFPFDRVQTWTGDADDYYMRWASSLPIVDISEHARAERKLSLNSVAVVHHGLPMTHFRPTTKHLEEYFVWLGRFVPEKGPHLAIEAAKKARVPLVLAGTIDRHVRESVDYFEQLIKPHIDQQQIRYIGPVEREQKMDVLSRARGLLNPIQWEEPFGMVMIEAMALGCPVIAFERGAAAEIVAHGRSGFLVEDVNAMVDGIARVDELDRMAVRAHAQSHFTVQIMAEKYSKVYKKTIATAMERMTSDYVSNKDAPMVISAPSRTVMPLSLTHLKRDVPELVPNQQEVKLCENRRN